MKQSYFSYKLIGKIGVGTGYQTPEKAEAEAQKEGKYYTIFKGGTNGKIIKEVKTKWN